MFDKYNLKTLTGHGWYNYLVTATMSMIMMGVSMDALGFSVVVASGACDLEVTLTQIGVLGSIPFIGLYYLEDTLREDIELIHSLMKHL